METISIRELKTQATAILRRVREEGTAFEITYRGRTLARLVPVTEPTVDQSVESFLERLDQTAEDIDGRWPANVSAVEAVCAVRREL